MNRMRVCAEIDLNKVKRNAQSIRNIIGENVKIMSVVKADGYGHGAIECAKAIDKITDSYAVATIEEAIELRSSGIDKEILVLGYIFPEYYFDALNNDISLTVFSFEAAEELSVCASKNAKTAKIHIATDTGMGRIGFVPNEESVDEIKKISKLSNIEIEGIFSHFSTADEEDKSYSHMQLEKFKSFTEKLEKNGIQIKTKHICNSAAITELPEARLDMVRLGIELYGLYPSHQVDKSKINLEQAMTLKSSVVHIKTIKCGESVSYGKKFTAKKDTVVATVSIGYADGYPRLASNKGRVIINGQYAPVIGNVCMDQIMVDATGIENLKVGSEVILFGGKNDVMISVDEIAGIAGTINYEIVCGIGKRVPRIYKQ